MLVFNIRWVAPVDNHNGVHDPTLVVEMKRNKHSYLFALVQALTISFGCVGSVFAQDESPIVKLVPDRFERVVSRIVVQDPDSPIRNLPQIEAPGRPNEKQDSESTKGRDQDKERSGLNDDVPILNDDLPSLNGEPNMEEQDQPQMNAQRDALGTWPRKGIRAISLNIRDGSDAPKDRSGQLKDSPSSQWTEFNPTPKVFAWAAPDIRYQPLYFEDVALERYGQTVGRCAQPTVSALRMTKALIFLPNQMRNDPPRSCDYPLGFCRPGNTVPYTTQRYYLGHPDK